MAKNLKRKGVPPGSGDRPRCVRWPSTRIIEFQRELMRHAGEDPAQVQDIVPFRFLTLREVRAMLGLSTASVYRAMAAGKLSRPVTLDGLTSASEPSP